MKPEAVKKLLLLRNRVVVKFNAGDWTELGLLTGCSNVIDGHSRLLRSLSWGDGDYEGNALDVLKDMCHTIPNAMAEIENYLDTKYPEDSIFVSAKEAEKRLTFAPLVFSIPEFTVDPNLVAIMMPFSAEFNPVHDTIKSACVAARFNALRVDDIWEESTVIQDIFNLILRASVVIVDFTSKNSNVMYETGIAHTLGKLVIPITQSKSDIPFDLAHHRFLPYLLNSEGLAKLKTELKAKLLAVRT